MTNRRTYTHYSPPSTPFSFTHDMLLTYLYRRNESNGPSALRKTGDKSVKRGLISSSLNASEKAENRLSNAEKSCPDELELCPSLTSCLTYGVRTKQVIPEGTWMGPYQGTIVTPNDVTGDMDTSYMWEIYENDKLLHYIDGNDENNSSWMRFICCARHRGEQNLYAFQYNKEIYYRAFATIPAGEELLVWYEDTYPQYMGIPLNITDIGRQLDHSANCPHHPDAVSRVDSAQHFSSDCNWRNQEAPRLPQKPVASDSLNSTVFAPPLRPVHYRTPTFFTSDEYQIAHVRREKTFNLRDQYGQLVPTSRRRAIVIQKTDDAPDPFCVLTREK